MAAPKLRFKEFDGNWNKNTIGNFILNYKGGASLTPADFVEYSDCEVIPKKAISSGGLLQLDKVVPTFCTLEFFNSNQNYIVDSEYLITTLRDLVPSGPSIGYIVKYESNKKYILAQGVYGFRIKNDLNRDFLIQFSNTSKFRLHMQSIMVGSTQVHIRNQDYFSTELYTPSLLEQTKIASFLSAVDEKISQLTQKHELLSQYKQGMMQKLFSQEIRFKADDGSEFGEWVKKTIGEIGEVITGKTPSTNNPNAWNGDILFVTPTDMNGNKYQTTTIRTVANSHPKILPQNAIMFTCIASIGKMSLSVKPCITNQQINSVVVKKDQPEFIYYQLLNMVDYIKSTQANTTLPIINKTEFSKFILKIPQYAEQTKIANFLSAIDQKIEVVAQQIEQAKQWKKGLLQQMFV